LTNRVKASNFSLLVFVSVAIVAIVFCNPNKATELQHFRPDVAEQQPIQRQRQLDWKWKHHAEKFA
jgi:hypothetical protein